MVPSPTYLAMRAYTRGRLIKARLSSKELRWSGVRILGYHRVADERDDLAVRPQAFREQMERVVDAGLEVVRLDRAVDLLERRVEGRYLCVTFDDGYRDNLEQAAPVLTELALPATIFVSTAMIDGRARYMWFRDPPPALSWEEIDQLVSGGLIDVQAHTRSHARLPQVDEKEAWDEIAGSKQELEAHVPYEVSSFCYPAGLYTEREVRLVKAAGYRAGVTTDPGVNPGGEDLLRLRRTLVYWQDTIGDFAIKLAGGLDRPPRLRGSLYRKLARG